MKLFENQNIKTFYQILPLQVLINIPSNHMKVKNYYFNEAGFWRLIFRSNPSKVDLNSLLVEL
jgi:hypothetical protein